MKEIVISKNDSDQRVDKFLSKTYLNLPKTMLYKAIRKKDIKLNGKRCHESTKLKSGDVLTMYLKDEFFQTCEDRYDFLKAPKSLDILYEDNDLLIVNKKPGLIVHPDINYHFDSLIARIQHYLYESGSYDPKDEQSFTPALANRIDRNTGGIVMAAKTAEALRILNEKIRMREIRKFYLCIVCGCLKEKSGTLTGYLEKNEAQNRVYISDKPAPGRKTILTKYRVIKERNGFSLIEAELLTGRTHQIRGHFASIGHPLTGDGKYGTNTVNKRIGMSRQALFSYKLILDFKTDAGALDHLNGKVIEADTSSFYELFNSLPALDPDVIKTQDRNINQSSAPEKQKSRR